jgi:hypothetical protein
MNPAEFELRLHDLVERPFDPDTFVFDFMAALRCFAHDNHQAAADGWRRAARQEARASR